jgi:hypothetical protein
MLEALWSIRVAVNGTQLGGGVLVIENGRVLGGDQAFIFVGDFKVKDDIGRGKIHVTQYADIPGFDSITGLNDYYGIFEGKIGREQMTLTGYVESNPTIKLQVDMTRRAELP